MQNYNNWPQEQAWFTSGPFASPSFQPATSDQRHVYSTRSGGKGTAVVMPHPSAQPQRRLPPAKTLAKPAEIEDISSNPDSDEQSSTDSEQDKPTRKRKKGQKRQPKPKTASKVANSPTGNSVPGSADGGKQFYRTTLQQMSADYAAIKGELATCKTELAALKRQAESKEKIFDRKIEQAQSSAVREQEVCTQKLQKTIQQREREDASLPPYVQDLVAAARMNPKKRIYSDNLVNFSVHLRERGLNTYEFMRFHGFPFPSLPELDDLKKKRLAEMARRKKEQAAQKTMPKNEQPRPSASESVASGAGGQQVALVENDNSAETSMDGVDVDQYSEDEAASDSVAVDASEDNCAGPELSGPATSHTQTVPRQSTEAQFPMEADLDTEGSSDEEDIVPPPTDSGPKKPSFMPKMANGKYAPLHLTHKQKKVLLPLFLANVYPSPEEIVDYGDRVQAASKRIKMFWGTQRGYLRKEVAEKQKAAVEKGEVYILTEQEAKLKPSNGPPTRKIEKLTSEQAAVLTTMYSRNKNPTREEFMELVDMFQMPFKKLYKWFEGKRRYDRQVEFDREHGTANVGTNMYKYKDQIPK